MQKSALLDAHHAGVVSGDAFARLMREIDQAIDAVDHPEERDPP